MKSKKVWIVSLVILFLVVIFTVYFVRINSKQIATTSSSQMDLNRPLVVGVVSWPGYAGGIVANGGFNVNPESIFTKKYGLPVKFELIEDIDARGKAFAKGGPDGVDVVWTTIDFWANELPNFEKGGIDGKAFMQVDWSRGGDAIVASTSIKSVEDLKNKKIALVQYTPSQWLLESALRKSSLSSADQDQIRKNLVFTQDVPSARLAFVAGQVDAAVVWEPDVSIALKKSNSHILVSSKDFPNSIADMMVAKKDFIDAHPKAMAAFVKGWLDGVDEAKAHTDTAAKLLVENEPLFTDLGIDATKNSLSWVYWPNLADNARMFGLDGKPALFDSVFKDAGAVWTSLGAIQTPVDAKQAKDDSFIRNLYSK